MKRIATVNEQKTADLSQILNSIDRFPTVLNQIIKDYCIPGPQDLLDFEENLHQNRTPSCDLLVFIRMTHYFRYSLREVLTAVRDNKAVEILQNWDMERKKATRILSFSDPRDAYEYLIKTGITYYHSNYPHSVGETISVKSYLDPDKYLLEKTQIAEFTEDMLLFENRHSPIFYTNRELNYLVEMIKLSLKNLKYCSDICTQNLSIFLEEYLQLITGENSSCYILEKKSEEADYIIYVDNKYPQTFSHLIKLKLETPKFQTIVDSYRNACILKELSQFLPDVIASTIVNYFDARIDLDHLLNSLESIEKFPFFSRDILLTYKKMLTAIQQKCSPDFVDKDFRHIKNFNPHNFIINPLETLAQWVMQPQGLLQYFHEYKSQFTDNEYLVMSNLIGDTLNLIKTHQCIEINSFFYANIYKYLGIKLPVVTAESSLEPQQKFLKTLNQVLAERLEIKNPLNLLLIHNKAIKLYCALPSQHFSLLLLSLTPIDVDINFAAGTGWDKLPKDAKLNLHSTQLKYSTSQLHCARVMGVISQLDGYGFSLSSLNSNELQKQYILQDLIQAFSMDAMTKVVNTKTAIRCLKELIAAIDKTKQKHSALFAEGIFFKNTGRQRLLQAQTEAKTLMKQINRSPA